MGWKKNLVCIYFGKECYLEYSYIDIFFYKIRFSYRRMKVVRIYLYIFYIKKENLKFARNTNQNLYLLLYSRMTI